MTTGVKQLAQVSATNLAERKGAEITLAILRVAEEHFGTANANQLRAWGESVEGASEDLNPSTDQKYYDVNSELQPTPTVSTATQLPNGLEAVHLLWTPVFMSLLNAPQAIKGAYNQEPSKSRKSIRQALGED